MGGLLKYSPRKWRDSFYRSRLNFQPLPKGISLELAKNRNDLDQAFRILHDAYVNEGFSKPFENARRVTDYHVLPSTSTVVAKYDGRVIGTISIIRDGLFGLPLDKLVDLSGLRREGLRLGEVSSLAISPEFRGQSGIIMFYLLKYIVTYSLNYFAVDNLLITVNPSRKALYESLLMFKPLKNAAFRFADNTPGICMRLNLNTLEETWGVAYKGLPAIKNLYNFFFEPMERGEARQLHYPERPFYTAEDPVMTPRMLEDFFKECTDGLCGFSSNQIDGLKNIYPNTAGSSTRPQAEDSGRHDHRFYPRFDVDCVGQIPNLEKPFQSLKVLDASRKGLKVLARQRLPFQSTLPLSVVVGNRKVVAMETQLKWKSGCLLGLKIVSSGSLWDQFIAYMESRRSHLLNYDQRF